MLRHKNLLQISLQKYELIENIPSNKLPGTIVIMNSLTATDNHQYTDKVLSEEFYFPERHYPNKISKFTAKKQSFLEKNKLNKT